MQQPYVRRSYRRVDQRPIDVAPAADHSRRRRYTNIAAVVVAGLVAMRAASLIAEQTDATETKGQARVVERKGPEVEIRPGARAQVVVLFTHSAAQPGGAQQQGHIGGVEVVLVESEMAAASGDQQQQQQQGQARPTGREITFVEADAVRGVVSHAFEHSGNGRRMMVLARVNGKYVDVQQSGGGGEGVTLLTVPMPQQQQQQQQAQGQQSGGQPAGDGAAAAPAEGQQQPQPQQPPGQAAVIMMYTGGGGATQQ